MAARAERRPGPGTRPPTEVGVESASGAAPHQGHRLSVIVPTKDSARTIRACLASIRSQTWGNVELVVIDNGSIDGTDRIARSLADRTITAGPERSRQRNLGATTATGEYLVFVDSDMVVSPTVAEEVVGVFQADPRVEAVVIPERSVGQGYWARCRAFEKELYVGDPAIEAARAFRRGVFEFVGGYDERLHAGEDWDLAERVRRAAGPAGRIGSAILHDEGRLSLRSQLAKKAYYGRSFARYVRKHPAGAAGRVFRGALVRGLPQMVRHPDVAVGMVVLKTLELLALGIGVAASGVRAILPRATLSMLAAASRRPRRSRAEPARGDR